MSKRGAAANFGFGEDRYGGYANDGANEGIEETPMKATAAQMARRKIAQAKRPTGARGRSGSPATFNPQQQQQQQQFNSASFGFAFGGGAPPQQNGAPPTNSFQFGTDTPAPSFGASAPAPPTNMQLNGNIFGSGGTGFGTSFTAGASQPQQNGFNPSTSSALSQPPQTPTLFGGVGQTQQNGASGAGNQQQGAQNGGSTFGFGQTQQENKQLNNPFAKFGQSQKENENPSTPFAGFGNTQTETEKPNNPFSSFGQAQQEKEKPSTPFNGFGNTQPEKDKPSNPFASFGQNPAESSEKASMPAPVFGQKPQENGDKPASIFAGFGQKTQEKDDKPSNPFANLGQKAGDASDKPSTLFGQKPVENGSNPLFGQQNKSAEQQTPKASFSFGQPNGEKPAETQTPKTDLFGKSQSQTANQTEQSKLGTSNLFSQPSQSTQATSNLFGATTQAPQPNGEKKGLFGSSLAPTAEGNGEKQGLFGSSLTPAAGSNGTGSIFSSLAKKDAPNGGKPLFSSADPSQVYNPEDDDDDENEDEDEGDEQDEQPAAKPSGSFFGSSIQNQASTQDTSMTTPQASQTSQAAPSTQTPAPRSLFDRVDKDDMANRLNQPTPNPFSKPAETPKTGFFGGAPETPATAKPLFQSAAPSATPAAPPMFQQPAVSETPKGSPPKNIFQKPSTPAARTAFNAYNPPATAPAARTAPAPPAATRTATSAANLSAEQSKFKDLNNGLLEHLKRADITKDWTSLMQYYMRMAAGITRTQAPPEANDASAIAPPAAPAPSSNNVFSQTARPAQTPKQTAGSDLFSKPPSTAPPAKKRPFEQQADDGSAQAPATEKRSKHNEPVNYPKLPQSSSSTSKLFADVLDKKDSASASGFNPATKSLFSASTSAAPSTPAAATGGFKPTPATTTGGFKPTFTAPSGDSSTNFLSAFGQKAKAQEEKDRKKRKAEYYDSDEETEEAWEKRDREEQEAKRQKFEEATKASKGFTLSTPSASTGAAKSPFAFGSTSGSAPANPATQPQAPKFGGLFGASTASTSANDAGKLAPSTGFNFGAPKTPSLNPSLNASRATTPGVTTDGETSNAADDAEPSDEAHQDVEDHSALQASERETNEILLDMPNTSTKLYTKKEGADKPSWQPIQSGRMYVLKEKSTGATRILAKVGLGRAALNYKMVPGMKYELHPKKSTMVVATFMDHIHNSPNKLERFYIDCANKEQAEELSRLLTEGAAMK